MLLLNENSSYNNNNDKYVDYDDKITTITFLVSPLKGEKIKVITWFVSDWSAHFLVDSLPLVLVSEAKDGAASEVLTAESPDRAIITVRETRMLHDN